MQASTGLDEHIGVIDGAKSVMAFLKVKSIAEMIWDRSQ
jgi:hypothetical protein